MRAVAETGGDGAAVGGRGGQGERCLQGGQGGGGVHAAVAEAGIPAVEGAVLQGRLVDEDHVREG